MKSQFCKLCETVMVGDTEYRINTDFSVWIEIEHIIFGKTLTDGEALAKIFALAYQVLPKDPEAAFESLLWFYSAGESSKAGDAKGVPSYDLVLDFEYVWGAFLSEFGIDLFETRMHWWKFRALLSCLSENCRFSQIVNYRSMDLSKVKDAEQRQFYERMKKRFRLPDMRTEDEKTAETATKLEVFF